MPREGRMKTKILLVLVLAIFLLVIFAGGALAAKQSRIPRVLPLDGAQPPEAYPVPSPVLYEGAKQADCQETYPEVPLVQGPDIWGYTFYDYQSSGSMGRMIAVSSAGRRGMVFHETRGPYDPGPGQVYGRYVTYNCKDNDDTWGGPTYIHGGAQVNAGYANIMMMHDGREIVLDHRTAGTPMWYTCLIVSDEGFPCSGYFTNVYDLADEHDFPTGEGHGFWPKGCIVYDANVDTDYIHIVTTEPVPSAGDPHTIAYQRCVFQGDALVCFSPGYGPYTRNPGIPHILPSPIAVIDTTMTISAVAVSSPVSEKVAIVYAKHRTEDTSKNADVMYIESTNNGDDWLDLTQWPPIKYNVTNYDPLWPERAWTDVAACYDYNDNLHIVWNSCHHDSATGDRTEDANLMHWTDTDPLGFDNATLVAPGYWDDGTVNPGTWNRILSKMSVAAMDPIYYPGGYPDSVYLFCTWTQFNLGDNSLSGMTNGDIYATVSPDGGFTWAPGYNLTNTQTPGCAPGECLSEHWSSLAENMYGGDLHIEYVCDRDAGGAATPQGAWTDNDMMYVHVWVYNPPPQCGISVSLVDPSSFSIPPIKVPSDPGYRVISLKIWGIYNLGGYYEVTTDHPKVTCQTNCSGYLSPGQDVNIEVMIDCAGQEEFVEAKITVTGCEDSDPTVVEIPLYAVCSDDYFECDRDSATFIEKDNNILKLWACVNTSQEVWDQRITDEERQKVIFSGGVIVATTAGEDTVVGRQDYRDVLTGARDTINVVQGYDYFEPECNIQKIHVKDTYIWTPHLLPPNDFKWWWIDIHKQIILFHDRPGYTCPEWKKEQVIKHVWIDWGAPPGWWPDPGVYQGHQDIYFGVFADVDAPFDQGCNGCNTAGYDYDRQMIWQHGYSDGTHPEYEDHYIGVALTDPSGAVVAPWGVQNVLSEEYLYPQESWGWLDGELYQLAATPGVNIHHPDSVADRTVVLTADMIPAGTEDDFESEFILIEASVPTGLGGLQAHMDDTREVLIPELYWLGLFSKEFPVCGDATNDGEVNIADVVKVVHYLFLGSGAHPWPLNRADVNHDGAVNVADIVGLVNYLFHPSHPALDCSGFGRE